MPVETFFACFGVCAFLILSRQASLLNLENLHFWMETVCKIIWGKEMNNKYQRLWAGLFVCLLLFGFTACTSKKASLKEHLQKGQQALAAGKVKTAVIELKNAVQLAPKNARAHYLLAKALLRDRDGKGAFRQFSITTSLNPANIDAQYKLATAFLLGGKYDECRKRLKIILAREPDNQEAIVLLANLNMATGNLASALSGAEKAIKIKGDNPRLWVLKAKILERQKKFGATEEALRKALSLKPHALDLHQALATFYLSRRRFKEAGTAFEAMVREATAKDKARALMIQAGFYEDMKKPALAEKALLAAVAKSPSAVPPLVGLANFYQRRKNFSRAEEFYKKAIKQAAKPGNIQGLLANLYFDFRHFSEADELVKKILGADKGNLNGRIVKAKLLVNDKKYEAALTLLAGVLRDQPRSAEAHFVRAYTYYKKGNIGLAKSEALAAVQYSPRHYKARLLLADIYLRNNAVSDAKRQALAVLQIDPTNLQGAMILAECLLREKDYKNARSLLGNIQKAVPRAPRVYQLMGLVDMGGKQLEAARGQFSKALALAPQSARTLAYLVGVMLKQGKKAAAWQLVQAQVKKFPKNPALLMQQGLLALRLHKEKAAEQSFEQMKKLAPQSAAPYILLGGMLQKQGQAARAIAQYRGALQDNPSLISARMQLGILLEQQGHDDEAAENYRKILADKPEFGPAANNLAWYMSNHSKDLGEALRLALVAKSGAPDDPYVADTLGWVHYKRGSYSLAKTQFIQARKSLADNPTVNYHLGLAYMKLHDKGQAVHYLQQAVKLAQDKGALFAQLQEARQLIKTLGK